MNRHYALTARAVAVNARAEPDTLRVALRWLLLGIAGGVLVVLALSRAGTVGAAAPADCVPINYTTCVSNGVFYTNGNPVSSITPTYVAPTYSYVSPYVAPAYTTTAPAYVTPSNYTPTSGSYLVSSYPDPRYCGGVVNVWNEGGNLINRCPDGTRVYPVFTDYGYGYGYGRYIAPYYSGYYGGYAYPYYSGYYGWPYYTGVYNGSYTVVAPSGNLINVGAPYRVTEISQPAAAPVAVTQAAPSVTTTVAAPAAPTAAQVAAPAPVPAASVATGLNAPASQAPTVASGGAGVKVMSVQTTATPVAANDGREDGK